MDGPYVLRLVNIAGQGDFFQIMPDISNAFPEYYKKLVSCESVQCQVTGTIFPAVRSPTMAVIEVRAIFFCTPWPSIWSNPLHFCNFTIQLFHFPVLLAIRAITNKTVPVLAWYPGASFSSLRLFGPEELGGLGDIPAKAKALSEATGRDMEDIAYEVFLNPLFAFFQFLISESSCLILQAESLLSFLECQLHTTMSGLLKM